MSMTYDPNVEWVKPIRNCSKYGDPEIYLYHKKHQSEDE